MEQREGKTGRGGRGSSRRAPLAPAKSVLPCPGAGVADGHGAPSPARSRLVMLPKVETEALGLTRSNGEQGQMPENMQGKGANAGLSPSAPRTLGFPSAKRPFVLPKKFAAVACELPRHLPLRAPPSPCLRGPAFRGAQRVPGPGCQPEARTRPCSEGANGAEELPSIRPTRACPGL